MLHVLSDVWDRELSTLLNLDGVNLCSDIKFDNSDMVQVGQKVQGRN